MSQQLDTTNGQSSANGCTISKASDVHHQTIDCHSLLSLANSVAKPSRCTWKLDDNQIDASPHHHVSVDYLLNRSTQIQESIADYIGQTPIIKCQNLANSLGFKCQLLAKCEFLNPGGSVKDRIAARMVQEAEREGRLVPHSGYTIIEPTSGNTGIGLAMVAACRGYRCIIVMPEKMSLEKEAVMRVLGAHIVRTPTEAAYNASDSHITRAFELAREIGSKAVVLNQYCAAGNPLAHYDTTAEEIIVTCNGRLDMLVVGAGTGGTLSGIGRKIKERLPGVKLIGVDPLGSILASPEDKTNYPTQNGDDSKQNSATFYEVEGIGYDFVPTVLDRQLVDRWYKTNDCESLQMARQLISRDGLLAGGSSGAAMAAAVRATRDFGWQDDPSRRIVVVLPDGVRNYMSKFLDDTWMRERKFM